jgi:hypothetical protein
MKTGFKDKMATKKKTIKNPWNYEAPCFDDRQRMSAGIDYGVGYNQPVGSVGSPKSTDILPKGRVDTMSLKRDYKSLDVEE